MRITIIKLLVAIVCFTWAVIAGVFGAGALITCGAPDMMVVMCCVVYAVPAIYLGRWFLKSLNELF